MCKKLGQQHTYCHSRLTMQKTQANYLDSKAEWKTDTRFNGWQSDPIANVGLSARIANVGTLIAYCQRCAPLDCFLRQRFSFTCTCFYWLSCAKPIRRLFAAYLPPTHCLLTSWLCSRLKANFEEKINMFCTNWLRFSFSLSYSRPFGKSREICRVMEKNTKLSRFTQLS